MQCCRGPDALRTLPRFRQVLGFSVEAIWPVLTTLTKVAAKQISAILAHLAVVILPSSLS